MPHETWVRIGDKTPEHRDDLALWAIENRNYLVPDDRSYDTQFGQVYGAYAWPDGRETTEADIVEIGDDYALIACARHNGLTVVTNEVRSGAIGANSKVPNVCDALGVACTDLDGRSGRPGLIDLLDFSVDWDHS